MNIGNLKIKGIAALAPMAGVTDNAFRNICSSFGSAFVVSEMISAKALTFGDKKTKKLMSINKTECPCGIQLFGSEAETMSKATELVMEFSPDFIDINMGCPAPKITSSGAGSALMNSPKLCGDIVKAVKAVSTVPVTVKIRKGWDKDHINAVEIAKICEDNGADAIVVHGRTKSQMYRPSVDLGIIKAVKEAVSIPVIGNGDIASAYDAANMMEQTNCDLVMIGRAALGNPWIFREILTFFKTDKILPPAGIRERLYVISKQVKAMCEEKGEHIAMLEARKHIAWYLKGFPGAAKFRTKTYSLTTLHELYKLLAEINSTLRNISYKLD